MDVVLFKHRYIIPLVDGKPKYDVMPERVNGKLPDTVTQHSATKYGCLILDCVDRRQNLDDAEDVTHRDIERSSDTWLNTMHITRKDITGPGTVDKGGD